MVEDEWDNESDDHEVTEDSMCSMPLYDEDGIEIPDEELPWNCMSEEILDADDSEGWADDTTTEADVSLPIFNAGLRRHDAGDGRIASERRKRIAQSVREEALRRLELSARTTADFQSLVNWYDREEQSRIRLERRYESLRGDTLAEIGVLPDGDILPSSMSQPTFRQICRGEFDDYLASCLFEMHDLTDRAHLRDIVMNLKLDYKEILFFLGIRLYPTQKLAELRGQTERNIRKVRDTVRRRIQRKLFAALTDLQKSGGELIHLEQDFLSGYTPPKRGRSTDDEPV